MCRVIIHSHRTRRRFPRATHQRHSFPNPPRDRYIWIGHHKSSSRYISPELQSTIIAVFGSQNYRCFIHPRRGSAVTKDRSVTDTEDYDAETQQGFCADDIRLYEHQRAETAIGFEYLLLLLKLGDVSQHGNMRYLPNYSRDLAFSRVDCHQFQ